MRADEEHRHECEVRDCVRRFYPDGDAMASHLDKITKRRGKEAADRLRADVRAAWMERRAAA